MPSIIQITNLSSMEIVKTVDNCNIVKIPETHTRIRPVMTENQMATWCVITRNTTTRHSRYLYICIYCAINLCPIVHTCSVGNATRIQVLQHSTKNTTKRHRQVGWWVGKTGEVLSLKTNLKRPSARSPGVASRVIRTLARLAASKGNKLPATQQQDTVGIYIFVFIVPEIYALLYIHVVWATPLEYKFYNIVQRTRQNAIGGQTGTKKEKHKQTHRDHPDT